MAANYVNQTNVFTRLCKTTSSIGCVRRERWGTYKAMYFWHRLRVLVQKMVHPSSQVLVNLQGPDVLLLLYPSAAVYRWLCRSTAELTRNDLRVSKIPKIPGEHAPRTPKWSYSYKFGPPPQNWNSFLCLCIINTHTHISNTGFVIDSLFLSLVQPLPLKPPQILGRLAITHILGSQLEIIG